MGLWLGSGLGLGLPETGCAPSAASAASAGVRQSNAPCAASCDAATASALSPKRQRRDVLCDTW